MPSLDNIIDLCEVIKTQGYQYVLLTINYGRKNRRAKQQEVDVRFFSHLPSKNSKRIALCAIAQIAEGLNTEINTAKKNKLNK